MNSPGFQSITLNSLGFHSMQLKIHWVSTQCNIKFTGFPFNNIECTGFPLSRFRAIPFTNIKLIENFLQWHWIYLRAIKKLSGIPFIFTLNSLGLHSMSFNAVRFYSVTLSSLGFHSIALNLDEFLLLTVYLVNFLQWHWILLNSIQNLSGIPFNYIEFSGIPLSIIECSGIPLNTT